MRLFLIIIVLFSSVVYSAVYKCKTESGKVIYSPTPCKIEPNDDYKK